jgi:hypothetical protein
VEARLNGWAAGRSGGAAAGRRTSCAVPSHKAQHRQAILLFRLGDFYEMFYEDATIASRDLDLTR